MNYILRLSITILRCLQQYRRTFFLTKGPSKFSFSNFVMFFSGDKHVFLAHGFGHDVTIERLRAGALRNRVKSAIEK